MVRATLPCGEGKRWFYTDVSDNDIVVFKTREEAEQRVKADDNPAKWSHTVALNWTTPNKDYAKGMQLWECVTKRF